MPFEGIEGLAVNLAEFRPATDVKQKRAVRIIAQYGRGRAANDPPASGPGKRCHMALPPGNQNGTRLNAAQS